MKYSFTFDTVAAYQAAKNSSTTAADGGHPIYDALVTNSAGYVSRTAISTITGTGETFVDAVNIIVPRDKGGEVGDMLLFKDSKYYWLKGWNTWDATSKGGNFALGRSNDYSTIEGYTVVGFVGHREGNKCMIFYRNTDGITMAAWGVSGVHALDTKSLELGNGATTTPMSLGLELVEGYYLTDSNRATYTSRYVYPINRNSWNEMVTKIFTNTSSDWSTTGIAINSSSSTQQGWKVEATTNGTNLGVGTVKAYVRSTITTIDPSYYDYDYDKWYKETISVKPLSSKADNAMNERSGRYNTADLYALSSTNYPHAAACLAYSISGASEFGAGKWWWPSFREMWLMTRNLHILKQKGIDLYKNSHNFWTSTQSSDSNAWSIRNYCAVTTVAKSTSLPTLPVAEFYI